MIRYDQYRASDPVMALIQVGHDRHGAGGRQCCRHWPCRGRSAGQAAKARDHNRNSYCNRSSKRIRQHSNAIAADI